MFIHNFKYALKTLFRSKSLIFWTFAFPILLGIFFNMAFSDLENSEKLDIINIAIVNNEDFEINKVLVESFKAVSDEKSDERIFNTKYVTEKKAKELLKDDKISGYVMYNGTTPKVVIKTNGINETVLKYVTEELTENTNIINDLVASEVQNEMINGNANINYEKIYNEVISLVQNDSTNIKNISDNNLDYTTIEFYTLIAMACLYGGLLGTVSLNKSLPNMTANGKRVSVSCTPKSKLILSSVLASYIVQIIGVLLLLGFIKYILKVDFGNNDILVLILSLVGSLAGLSIGIAVGALIKTNENTKVGIIISVTMIGCFLSGMMGISMKYIVDKNFPIINKLNPASMITDGFYSLYYYDTYSRYIFDIVSLLIFSLILITVSSLVLRRQKYDSI